MNIRRLFTIGIIALLFYSSCKKDVIVPSNLHIICEEFRPFSYSENNALKGISVEIADSLMGCLGITERDIEITDNWEEAVDLLETSDNVVLFTTVMTSERKEKFKWVGPVMLSSMSFLSTDSPESQITSINNAKDLGSIGVVSGYPTTEILEKENFQNIVYFNTTSDAITALFNGTVESVFDLAEAVNAMAQAAGYNSNELKNLFTYSTVQGFYAFSSGVSSDVVELWQEKIDWLKTEGFVQKVYDNYLDGFNAPGLITIYTEENPPQSFSESNGKLSGSSVEIVQAIMNETGNTIPVIVNSWSPAYEQALTVPNTLLFSTLRSEAREDLFHWIGPVCRKSYCFFVKASGSITLSELNDAKNLQAVGVPAGWASENQLIDAGFTNIKSGATSAIVFEMLMDGTVDAAVLNDIAIESLASETGYQSQDARNELVLSTGDTYLAFNIDTKSEYVQEWQNAFTTIIENGTFDDIWKKWYPGIESPR
ncbi:MAG: transporter substrate-binding domain-containing protein [Prolixibacteraceae bacterium]|nr:transporter substrate-binding domain-containing protein [Prolixibacteraceae bacterium]